MILDDLSHRHSVQLVSLCGFCFFLWIMTENFLKFGKVNIHIILSLFFQKLVQNFFGSHEFVLVPLVHRLIFLDIFSKLFHNEFGYICTSHFLLVSLLFVGGCFFVFSFDSICFFFGGEKTIEMDWRLLVSEVI